MVATGVAVYEVVGPEFDAIAERTRAGMEERSIPGVAVGVLDGGREYVAGFGITCVDNPLPVTPDTLFQIGSISKTFTATAAMRLVEQGKLDLDAPVRRYLPEFRLKDASVAERVTSRHLFAHVGGWVGDYFCDTGHGDDALARAVEGVAELEQLTPLGETWSYSNSSFYIAGRIIEVLTGQTYERAMRELVFGPLGMDNTFFFPSDVMTRRFVTGHFVREGRATVARPWALARAANPVGGVTTSIRDLLKYARFWLGDGTAPDGTRLLSPERMREMQTPRAQRSLGGEACGVAWMLREVGGVRLINHGGATWGQMANLTIAPERGFAFAALTNANRGGELHTALTKDALKHFLGVDDRKPEPVARSEAELAEFAGRYSAHLADVELSVKAGQLVAQGTPKGGFPTPDVPPPPPPPPTRLAFIGQDRVVALDPPFVDSEGDFLRDSSGRIVWFRWGGRIARRQG